MLTGHTNAKRCQTLKESRGKSRAVAAVVLSGFAEVDFHIVPTSAA
jgi:hypothetical protein